MLYILCGLIFHPAQRCLETSPTKTSQISFLFFHSGSSGSSSVESVCTFVCDVDRLVELFTPQSNKLICAIVSTTDACWQECKHTSACVMLSGNRSNCNSSIQISLTQQILKMYFFGCLFCSLLSIFFTCLKLVAIDGSLASAAAETYVHLRNSIF